MRMQFTNPNINELENDPKTISSIRPGDNFCFIMNQLACGKQRTLSLMLLENLICVMMGIIEKNNSFIPLQEG